MCSRDLAIKPWTEAECVVDLILVCAVKVSGKFVLYNRVILSSMDPPAPPAHCSDVPCYWVQQSHYNPSASLTPLHTRHQASGPTQAPCAVCEAGQLVFLRTKNCKTWWPAGLASGARQLGLTQPCFHQEFLREEGEEKDIWSRNRSLYCIIDPFRFPVSSIVA